MKDILIEEQASVNICDCDEFNTLRLDAAKGDLKFVKYCLKDGCDINIRTQVCCYTPLHSAAESGHAEMTEFLLDNGADINEKTIFNHTVLELFILPIDSLLAY
ncbi:hypothetical protein AVEN_177897-1 [Araneus ventricosus]|uniref:Uncharacterized protein n=1 Tax=Araneus ventricosus TaxID=182803 RepID=A0A4Y2KB72_ARAVE|nr:hypothetical protein AVEN_177897-1 [Araneus ventricosus]